MGRRAGAAAADYEGWKRTFGNTADECARDGLDFYPMVAEPSGGWGPTAVGVFRRLVRCSEASSDVERSQLALRVRQRFSILVRKHAALAVLARGYGTG